MVDDAIKAIIKDGLSELSDKVGLQEQRCDQMSKTIEELSAKLEERDKEGQQLREELEKQKSETEALDGRLKTDLESLGQSTKDRADRLESDEDGAGGLHQVRQRFQALSEEFTKLQQRVEDSGRVVGSTKSRTDAFDEQLQRMSKKCEEIFAAAQASQERLQQIDASSKSTKDRQQVIEDSVAKKYDALWQDVLKAIEEVKSIQDSSLKEDLERRRQDARREGRGHVKYVTQLVAAVHDERRKLAISKDLVTAWREQAWMSARRRTGLQWLCTALQGATQRRERKAMDRWARAAWLESICKRLQKEHKEQIPDVQKILQDVGFSAKCDKLHEAVETLRSEKDQIREAAKTATSLMDERFRAQEAMRAQLLEHISNWQKAEASLRASDRLTELEMRSSSITEAVSHRAAAKDVQTMMRDILLIWNSIKQLDAAKADKKDVDSFAVESGNRERNSTRRLADLHAEVTGVVREETLRVHEKWTELDVKVSESTKQLRHWGQMWEKLAAYVEELVGKIGDLQNQQVQRLPTTIRRPSSANSRGRTEVPPLPFSGTADRSMAEAITQSRVSSPSRIEESRMLWVGSAKGLLETEGLEAGTPKFSSNPKRAPRPQSAPRRPHDWGR